MKKLTAIVIDDNPKAINLLSKTLNSFFKEEVTLLATYNSGSDALKEVLRLSPDIIFLDIEMPEIDGFEMASLLPSSLQSKIVIVSGNESYALKAIKHAVFDFLTKPVVLTDLRNCINKLQQIFIQTENVNQPTPEILVINRQDKTLLIEIDNISRIEASGPYTNIYYEDKKVNSSKNFSHYEELLNGDNFIKLHRSCIVNIKQIKEVIKFEGGGVLIMNDGSKLELSRTKKNELIKHLTLNNKS